MSLLLQARLSRPNYKSSTIREELRQYYRKVKKKTEKVDEGWGAETQESSEKGEIDS
jgi:hypothetical protein